MPPFNAPSWKQLTKGYAPDAKFGHPASESQIAAWGNDENGNDYYWLTVGLPDTWTVPSDEVRGEGFREYGCAMTDFLTKVLTGECEALAGDYPTDEGRVFEAWTK